LWSALPDFDTSMTNNLGVQSAEGAEVQRKLREKMIVNAVSELSPFNGIPEDFIEWRDNAVITFRQAGRGAVLLPNFHEWAECQGWSPTDIDEADEWAHVILKAALSGCDDALDVFNCAPAGEGSTAFAFLRRHYELLSSNVKEKLRMKIEKFAPLTGEDPLRMIARLNKMYVSYAKSINPEPQSTESKIRKVLTLCAKFSSLSVKIKMIRSSLSSGDRPPRKMTYVCTCEEITAEWLSFGEEDSVQINAMKVSEVTALRAEMEELRIKVAHGAATSNLGQGKTVRFGANGEANEYPARLEKESFGKCLVPACSNEIEAPKYVAKRPTMCKTCWSEFHDW